MAYTVNEFLVIITGTIPSGEIWSNTWCVLDIAGSTPRQDAVNEIRQFYQELQATLSNDWTASTATTKELLSGLSTPRSWEAMTGTAANANLPTECAVRVSLNDQNGHNGGPFIAGWTEGSLAADGTLTATAQGVLVGAIDGLGTNLQGEGFQLRINRPTVASTVPAMQAKIGKVYDVIRKRRNAINEAYTLVTL